MKKLLLSLAVLALGVSASNAETLYELTFNKDNNQNKAGNYTSTWTAKVGDTEWTLENFNNNNNAEGEESKNGVWDFVRCGRGGKNGAPSVATITNSTVWSEKINEIVINAKKNKTGADDKVNLAVVEVLSSLDAAEAVASYDITAEVNALATSYSDINVTLTEPAANMFYRIKFDMPKTTNNGWLQINSVTYNGIQEGPVLEDPALAFPQNVYTVMFGTAFDAPKAVAVSDGEITYSSSDESVATVDAATGAVEILAIGETKIIASIAATDVYKAATAVYELNVVDPDVIYSSKMGEDFTFEQVSGTYEPWTHDAQYGLKGSAYTYNTGINACEAIAVSPVIDLTNRKEITLDFKNAFNNYKIDNKMIDVADFEGYAYVVVKEEGAAEWTVLDNAVTAPVEFNWDFYANDSVSLDAYKGKSIQIGFKYVSTAECAGTWEVKEVVVKGKTATGVDGVNVEEAGEAVYYNMQGMRVANPEKGLYIVVKGGKSTKVIL